MGKFESEFDKKFKNIRQDVNTIDDYLSDLAEEIAIRESQYVKVCEAARTLLEAVEGEGGYPKERNELDNALNQVDY